MLRSGITENTPKRMLFGAGVYFTGIEYSETTAPTEEAIKAAIIGATKDGGALSITPEFFDPGLDGALVAVKELESKVGEVAKMEVSMAELTAETAARMTIGKLGNATDYDVVTSCDLEEGHYYSGFGYYGHFKDGRPCIIIFKNALCTSGLTTDAKSKENSVFKGTFECRSDIAYGVDKLPYAIFIRKDDGWKAESVSGLN